MNPRSLCRCLHVQNSHVEGVGPCRRNASCRCKAFAPVYPVYEALPAGVTQLREVSGGLTLAECVHAPETRRQRPTGAVYCTFCLGEPFFTDGFRLPVKRLVAAPAETRLFA